MLIPCPYCGDRDHSEFSYGGDANVKRPDNADSDSTSAWYRYVYERQNPRGEHDELWHHTSGCRSWIIVTRDTRNHDIHAATILDTQIE